MNIKERVKMIRSMCTIVNSFGDEDLTDVWITHGVADGDEDKDDDYLLEMYGKENFADVMACFCRIMNYGINSEEVDKESRKKGNGIIGCDGVFSKKQEYEVSKADTDFRTEDCLW